MTFAHPPGSSSDVRGGAREKKERKKERQRERARRFRERERMSRFSFFASRQRGKTCCYNKRGTRNEIPDSRKTRSVKKRKCQLGRVVSLLFSFLCFIANLARNKIAWKRSVAKHSNVEFLTLTPKRRLLFSTAWKEMEQCRARFDIVSCQYTVYINIRTLNILYAQNDFILTWSNLSQSTCSELEYF